MLGVGPSPYAKPKSAPASAAPKKPKATAQKKLNKVASKIGKTPKTSKAPKTPKALGPRAKARGSAFSVSRESTVPKRPGRAPASSKAKVKPQGFPLKNSFPVSSSGKFSKKTPKAPKAPKQAAKKAAVGTKVKPSSSASYGTQKNAIKQTLRTHTQKTIFHQKQAERLKTKGASDPSHASYAKYMSHINAGVKHRKGAASASRALSQHISNRPGGKKGVVTKISKKSIASMRY